MRLLIKFTFLLGVLVGLGALSINKGWLKDIAEFGESHKKEAASISKAAEKAAEKATGFVKEKTKEILELDAVQDVKKELTQNTKDLKVGSE